MSKAADTPDTPAAALERAGVLYKSQGYHSKAVHKVADCRALRSSEKPVETIEHRGAIPLRVECCQETDCWGGADE